MGGINDICVVITAYNAADTITRAIGSALLQPQVSEVIVVDDASSDDTTDVALRADAESGRVKVIRLDANVGPSAARNIAISKSTSEFIAILDADDHFVPGRFDDILDTGWDFIADNIVFISDEDGPLASSRMEFTGIRSRELTFDEFLQRNISHRARPKAELGFLKPIVRRSSWSRLRLSYDEQVRLGEDFIIYATALARGARFVLLERCGYIAQVRAGSLSAVHMSADLEALARADIKLIAELSGKGVPSERLRLLRLHLSSIQRKVAIHSLLDRKHEVGAMHAMLELVRTPRRLAYATTELLLDKVRRSPARQMAPTRMLMLPEEFRHGSSQALS